MPNVWNPKRGWVCNWNNKPASWWPNLDTPAWGEAFRNNVLVAHLLPGGKKQVADLEQAVVSMATTNATWNTFSPFLAETDALKAFHGGMLAGSNDALLYSRFVSELRNELFLKMTGNFSGNDNFSLVAQPDVMARALRRETKFDYLAGRTPKEVVLAAMDRAVNAVGTKTYDPGMIPVPVGMGLDPIPYSNRGTYIQIIQLGANLEGRNVVTPGVAAAGPHSYDQADLARKFSYKPMNIMP